MKKLCFKMELWMCPFQGCMWHEWLQRNITKDKSLKHYLSYSRQCTLNRVGPNYIVKDRGVLIWSPFWRFPKATIVFSFSMKSVRPCLSSSLFICGYLWTKVAVFISPANLSGPLRELPRETWFFFIFFGV